MSHFFQAAVSKMCWFALFYVIVKMLGNISILYCYCDTRLCFVFQNIKTMAEINEQVR